MRRNLCVALSVAGLLALASTSLAGVPVAANCEIWPVADTLVVRDTAHVYVIVRDLYGEPIPGIECDFISSRGDTDYVIGTPAVTNLNGEADAAVTTIYEPYFSHSHITVDVEGVVLGPVTVYWECRAGVDGFVRPSALGPTSPNPFRDATAIRLTLSSASDVRLEIFDVLGKKVRTLVRDGLSAGDQAITWDGKDDADRAVASGVYRVRMVEPAAAGGTSLILLR